MSIRFSLSFQSNVTVEEFRRMLRVYEESVIQTEVVNSMQQAMQDDPAIQKSLPRKSQLKPSGQTGTATIKDVLISGANRLE